MQTPNTIADRAILYLRGIGGPRSETTMARELHVPRAELRAVLNDAMRRGAPLWMREHKGTVSWSMMDIDERDDDTEALEPVQVTVPAEAEPRPVPVGVRNSVFGLCGGGSLK